MKNMQHLEVKESLVSVKDVGFPRGTRFHCAIFLAKKFMEMNEFGPRDGAHPWRPAGSTTRCKMVKRF